MDHRPAGFSFGGLNGDDCPDCIRHDGLCDRETCRRHILPQLAKPTGLLKLMGEALVEQKSRQATYELPESDEQKAYKVRRAGARKVARKRARAGRGALALWKKIKGIA